MRSIFKTNLGLPSLTSASLLPYFSKLSSFFSQKAFEKNIYIFARNVCYFAVYKGNFKYDQSVFGIHGIPLYFEISEDEQPRTVKSSHTPTIKQVGNFSTLTKNSGSVLLELPFSRRIAKKTRKYMHAETLALMTNPLYFPNTKYLNSCHGNTIIS